MNDELKHYDMETIQKKTSRHVDHQNDGQTVLQIKQEKIGNEWQRSVRNGRSPGTVRLKEV